jgi:AraC-like DNA-binding protein
MIRNHSPFEDTGAFELIGTYSDRTPKKRVGSLFSASSGLQLAAMPNAKARVLEFKLPGLTLGLVESTGHSIAVSESASFTILLPVQGMIRTRTRKGEFSGKAGCILAFPPDWRETKVTAEARRGFGALVLIIPRERLLQAATAQGLHAPDNLIGFQPRSFGSTEDNAALALAQLAGLLASDVSAKARTILTDSGLMSWEHLLMSKALDLLLGDRNPRLRPKARRVLVDQAMAFIEANYAAINTIADIAEACDVSVRTLETAFRGETDLSPSETLRNRRLDEAQRMIAQRHHLGITEIALACGFNHLGRFSGAYRSRFGVLPSAERAEPAETPAKRTSSENG